MGKAKLRERERERERAFFSARNQMDTWWICVEFWNESSFQDSSSSVVFEVSVSAVKMLRQQYLVILHQLYDVRRSTYLDWVLYVSLRGIVRTRTKEVSVTFELPKLMGVVLVILACDNFLSLICVGGGESVMRNKCVCVELVWHYLTGSINIYDYDGL